MTASAPLAKLGLVKLGTLDKIEAQLKQVRTALSESEVLRVRRAAPATRAAQRPPPGHAPHNARHPGTRHITPAARAPATWTPAIGCCRWRRAAS